MWTPEGDYGLTAELSSRGIIQNQTALMPLPKNVTQNPPGDPARAPHHSACPKVLKPGVKFPYL